MPMWLIVMKGFAGSGKSTLARALSRELGWPLVDKDDVKDLLDGHVQAAGPCDHVQYCSSSAFAGTECDL
jgi:predicted kinase